MCVLIENVRVCKSGNHQVISYAYCHIFQHGYCYGMYQWQGAVLHLFLELKEGMIFPMLCHTNGGIYSSGDYTKLQKDADLSIFTKCGLSMVPLVYWRYVNMVLLHDMLLHCLHVCYITSLASKKFFSLAHGIYFWESWYTEQIPLMCFWPCEIIIFCW